MCAGECGGGGGGEGETYKRPADHFPFCCAALIRRIKVCGGAGEGVRERGSPGLGVRHLSISQNQSG